MSRYSRQMLMEEIGVEGQKKLKKSSVLVVGCGGLGTVISDHLIRAGMGRIVIVDRDLVELENLQRQILFGEKDIGKPKAKAASERLRSINSDVEVAAVVSDINPSNAEQIISDVDIVLDGTDNMETRYLINDVCIKKGFSWVYGGAVSTYGMSLNIIPGETACLTCAFSFMPKSGSLPTCDTVGVLNTVPSIIASIQATEAVKILLGKNYSRELIMYDVWSHDFQKIKIPRNSSCKCCEDRNFEYLDSERGRGTTKLCGRNSVQVSPMTDDKISLDDLADRLKSAGDVKLNAVHLVFRTDDFEINVFSDGRAIIKGTEDEKKARSLYSKYIGN